MLERADGLEAQVDRAGLAAGRSPGPGRASREPSRIATDDDFRPRGSTAGFSQYCVVINVKAGSIG